MIFVDDSFDACFYEELINHPKVVRVVGFGHSSSVSELLAQNRLMRLSRALLKVAEDSDEAFTDKLGNQSAIYNRRMRSIVPASSVLVTGLFKRVVNKMENAIISQRPHIVIQM